MLQAARNQVEGFFDGGTSKQHRIYWTYQPCGEPGAVPWIIVHGNAGYRIQDELISSFNMNGIHAHPRGTGLSRPAGEATDLLYSDLARDIDIIHSFLGVPQVNVLAWSGGTAVAALFAQDHAAEIGRIVAYAPFFGTWDEVEDMFGSYTDRLHWPDFCSHYGTADPGKLIGKHIDAILDRRSKIHMHATQIYAWLGSPVSGCFSEFKQSRLVLEWNQLWLNYKVHACQMRAQYGLAPNEVANAFTKAAAANVAVSLVIPGADKMSYKPARALNLPNVSFYHVTGATHDLHQNRGREALRALICSMEASP